MVQLQSTSLMLKCWLSGAFSGWPGLLVGKITCKSARTGKMTIGEHAPCSLAHPPTDPLLFPYPPPILAEKHSPHPSVREGLVWACWGKLQWQRVSWSWVLWTGVCFMSIWADNISNYTSGKTLWVSDSHGIDGCSQGVQTTLRDSPDMLNLSGRRWSIRVF